MAEYYISTHTNLIVGMAIVAFISEANFAATTFGTAITLNIGWQVLYINGISDGRVSTLALQLMCMEGCVSLAQAFVLRRWLCSRFAIVLAVPVIVTLYVGQELMFVVDGPWLKRAIAGVLICMAVHRVWATRASPQSNHGDDMQSAAHQDEAVEAAHL